MRRGVEPPPPQAVVLNMYSTGLGIARDLGREGVPVIGVSSRPDAFGRHSRYCRALIGPDSQDEPDALAEFLAQLGDSLGSRAVLFPTRDADVRFLDLYRERLEDRFVMPRVSGDLLDSILNKARLTERARALGIPAPVTIMVRSRSDLEDNRGQFLFPSVLKPAYAYEWRRPEVWDAVGRRKGIKVDSFQDLAAAYAKIEGRQSAALVQEWIPGEEDQFYILGAYLDRSSRCRAEFTLRKLFQYPPGFGLGCLVSAEPAAEVRDLGLRLLQSMRYSGVAEVEFKRDGRTGAYLLIEVNPRHWDQHTVGRAVGVNLSYIAYRDLCGLDGRADASGGENVSANASGGVRRAYWIWGAGMLGCIKEDLRCGRVDWRKVAPLVSFRPKTYAVWSWDDPAPSWNLLTRGGTR